MFTGIVEETGVIETMDRSDAGARMTVSARRVLEDLEQGASVAVNGCCLTAVGQTESTFAADLSPETLARTNLGSLNAGSLVNLERPLRLADRLSGHFVLGHVDGTGELVSLDPVGDGNWWLKVRVPDDLLPLLVYKGSIAIDGISLTVASLDGPTLGVAIIPHTFEATALSASRPGDAVNLECDMLAKHLLQLLSAGAVELRSGSGEAPQ